MNKFFVLLLKRKALVDCPLEELLLVADDPIEERQFQKLNEMLIFELHIPFSHLQLEHRLDIIHISDGTEILIMHLFLYLFEVILCSCEILLLGGIDLPGLHFELVYDALEGEEELLFCCDVGALELKHGLAEFYEGLSVLGLLVDELYYPDEDIVFGSFSGYSFLEQLLDCLEDLIQVFLCSEIQLNSLTLPSLFCV